MLILTAALGIVYPLAVTGVGQLALPAQANGSLIRVDGEIVGSSLIGQSFTDAGGNARREWFQSRPSAAGAGYARGLSAADVSDLVESMIQQRDLGYLGEPTVNVLQLNIALAMLG